MVPEQIRFEWAMRRLLRKKANYVVPEGLFSALLGEQIHIVQIHGEPPPPH
jgi:hypothetical protein